MISSGKIESRTSRSSRCSSIPMVTAIGTPLSCTISLQTTVRILEVVGEGVPNTSIDANQNSQLWQNTFLGFFVY